MKIEIKQSLSPCGRASIPPSKSMAHRALICAALSNGESIIRNLPECDDVNATVGCLENLGSKIERFDGLVKVTGGNLVPTGIALDCNESASTLRFLIPTAVLTGKKAEFVLRGRLSERPLDEYERIFKLEKAQNRITVSGDLESGYTIGGDVSSQFCSGLMMALGVGGGNLYIENRLVSRPYAQMTAYVMERFGVHAELSEKTISVTNCKYKPTDFTVVGDWTQAAVFGFLNSCGGNVEIQGLDYGFKIGDDRYPMLFDAVKARKTVDISDNPDLGPILFCLAAVYGYGSFTGCERLKIKESDRIECMKAELAKFGIILSEKNGEIEISGRMIRPSEEINSHADHRIAMALSALLTLTGGVITGCECVSKSFPDFFKQLENAGVCVNYVK